MNDSSTSKMPRRRLAIIGAGSSGLVTLKYAIGSLPDWEIVCFEKSASIQGCWGNPFPGFVSTSTKYTTQFACFPEFDINIDATSSDKFSAFFQDGEYGQYLEAFASRFDLRPFIRLHCEITQLTPQKNGTRWELSWRQVSDSGTSDEQTINDGPSQQTEQFDAVAVCTGLAEVPKQVAAEIPTLSPADFRTPETLSQIRNERIVVIGGGESAVDYANRLSNPELNNKVFLSLRSGIRVSPRIHPIRGVPSDFLRTRWMLSIHEGLRNWIGERFVRARIRYESVFQRWFPAKTASKSGGHDKQTSHDSVKAEWAMKLTRTAKDDLFDMFHNKSDDFLDAVACGNLQIIGPPTDESHVRYHTFDSACVSKSSSFNDKPGTAAAQRLDIQPTKLVPAIGYQSRLPSLTDGKVGPADFYLGCVHVQYSNLFLIGFARPIIGNIPTISEVQARLVCGMLARDVPRPDDLESLHQQERLHLARRYPMLDISNVTPVEMFPYCDRLAKLMGEFPTARRLGGLRSWWRQQFTPATTLHYLAEQADSRERFEKASVFLPFVFVVLLTLLWPVDRVYRWMHARKSIKLQSIQGSS